MVCYKVQKTSYVAEQYIRTNSANVARTLFHIFD